MGEGCVCVARCVAVLGLLCSALALVPPLLTHSIGRDHSTLLPFLPALQETLLVEYHRKSITLGSFESLQALLNSVGENAWRGSLAVVGLAATNIALDLLMLLGTCCRVRCLMFPWLVISMVELIALGCPAVIGFSLLGTYLLLQGMFLPALLAFSTPTLLVLAAMAVWLTVLAAYWALHRDKDMSCGESRSCPAQSLSYSGYRHSQNRQFYNPRHRHTKPTAPNTVNLYPTLPLA